MVADLPKLTLERLQKLRELCLENARDLLASAQSSLDSWTNHVAYHLAVLALEEIGKLELLQMQYAFERSGREPTYRPDLDDHTKKIFWALWSGILGQTDDPKGEVDFHRGLAKQIHQNRLEYLYVNIDNPVSAKSKVSREAVKVLINLTEARLKHEETQTLRFDQEIDELTEWFILASENPDKRRFIFSKESFDKIKETKNAREWITWLKETDETRQIEVNEIFEREKNRAVPEYSDDLPLKWKIVVHFISEANPIRPSFFAEWARNATHIILDKGKTNRDIIAQFLLPSSVSVSDVHDKGWTFAKIFVTALNIGTMGLFWWYVPSQNNKYFERIVDVENEHAKIDFAIPDLSLDWQQRPLKSDDVFMIKLVMSYMVRIKDTPEQAALDAYFDGVSFFASSDVHLQLTLNAFQSFYLALAVGMKTSGELKNGVEFEEALIEYLGDGIDDVEDFRRLIGLGRKIPEFIQNPAVNQITLKEVQSLKSFCDAFFMFRAAVVVRVDVHRKHQNPNS